MFKLTGILPALLTPFDEEGNVNLNIMRDLIEWQITQGVSGFYILGSTGEGLLLSEGERRTVAEAVVQQVKRRVPVVVHVGAITTQTSLRPGGACREIGADATSAVPPFYFNVGVEGVKQHYVRIAAASSLPFYIYNIPATTGVTLGVDTVRDLLAAAPTLRGHEVHRLRFLHDAQVHRAGRRTVECRLRPGRDDDRGPGDGRRRRHRHDREHPARASSCRLMTLSTPGTWPPLRRSRPRSTGS